MQDFGKGWLVCKGHYSEHSLGKNMVDRQKAALDEKGVDYDFINVYEASRRLAAIFKGEMKPPKWVLFRNADMGMRQALELLGTQCVNSYQTACICRDKFLTATFCRENGLPHPLTMKVPALPHITPMKQDFLDMVESVFTYPMVVKDEHGEEGKGVILVHDRSELDAAIPDDYPSCIIQEFIDSSFGVDARIFVVGGRVPLAVKRTNDNGDFRSNTATGGSMERYELTDVEEALALKVGELLPDSSMSVDIMWKRDGSPIICEFNGNPNFGSFKKRIFDSAPVAAYIADMIDDIDKR